VAQAGSAESRDRLAVAAKLPIYKKFLDHAHTHRYRESLSQHWGANVPNSPMIDIEQAHRNDAELRQLAVHQAQNKAINRARAFRKYNSTIG
jgi:hypothetical protein